MRWRDGGGLMQRRTKGVCLERMLGHQQQSEAVGWGDNGLVWDMLTVMSAGCLRRDPLRLLEI